MSERLFEVEDLNVWFASPDGPEVHAVRGVNFGLDSREAIGLVGESGCGKSTTILALMGLLPSSATVSGHVYLNGVDVLAGGEKGVRQYRWRDVAMVFQGAMNAFNPVARVDRQIADAIRFRGRDGGTNAADRARELLRMVGIPDRRTESYPHELSGGMRQRAAIALALSCEPKVLLADEPTTALDVMVQAQIMDLLHKLCDERDLAMVLVSHDLPLVAQVCSRINVMYAGECIESGPVDELFDQAGHPYTRMLLAATPDIDSDDALRSIPGSPPRLDRRVTGCAFRPRCDVSFERCADERPDVLQIGRTHVAACHHNDPSAAGSGAEARLAKGSGDGTP